MKTAIVYDCLTQFGGGERVFGEILATFPHADVYTAYADLRFVQKFFPKIWPNRIYFSQAQNSFLTTHGSLFQFLAPWIWQKFDFQAYDLVFSISGYLASNLIKPGKAKFIQYLLCPPKNIFGLDKPFPKQKYFPYWLTIVPAFKKALKSTPYIIADSDFIADSIKKISGILPQVIYPPVNIPTRLPKRSKSSYFLCVSRIDYAKSLELAILACNKLRLPLKIVGAPGDVPYDDYLRSIAGPTIEFLGFLPDKEIQKLYERAIAFIFTSKNEDFGIAPVEAMAHGVPVIAFYGGGAKETVVKGKTGQFFYEHTADSLVDTLTEFKPGQFSSLVLYKHARKFSKEKFQKDVRQYLEVSQLINFD